MEQKQDNRITTSRQRTAQTCLRKEYLAYGLALRPDVDAQALRFGSAMHVAFEARSKGETTDAAYLAAVVAYDYAAPATMTPEKEYAWQIERVKLNCLLTGYWWRWEMMDTLLRQVETEWVYDLPLVNPETGHPGRTHTLAGKVDGIVKLPDDRLVVMEHKTASDDLAPEGDYWKRLRIDSQVSNYIIAAREKGHAVEAVLYDVIRKPTIRPSQVALTDELGFKIVLDAAGERVLCLNGRPRQTSDTEKGYVLQSRIETPDEFQKRLFADITERPDFYFARREVPRLDADLEEARYELWQIGGLLRDCYRLHRHPRNTNACIGYGKCPYFDLCTTGYDIESGTVPDGFVRVSDVHPELTTTE